MKSKTMASQELKLTIESLENELNSYNGKPNKCLFEYIWNSFDAGATEVKISSEVPENISGVITCLQIEDNGKGWDFVKEKNTRTFLSTSKKLESNKNKSLPRGKYGRGRYVFIWIAGNIEILSKGKKLILNRDTKVEPVDYSEAPQQGTKIIFKLPHLDLSSLILNEKLFIEEIINEFCWFLKENSSFKIFFNGNQISFDSNIKEEISLSKKDFPSISDKYINDNFKVDIVLWEKQPSEWSSFYFINEQGSEIRTDTTKMNKKSDGFWHSVYIRSNLFIDGINVDNNESMGIQYGSEDEKERKRVKREILNIIKQKLVDIRKPYLIENSKNIIDELKKEKALPDLPEYGIYDEESFEELLKVTYRIAPSLFVGRDKKEKKFICATFAGLLSTQDSTLFELLLEQLAELSEDEKKDLLDILQRTSLTNVVKTIKEIDHRLYVLDHLEKLLFEYRKETLEVKHLQKVLNEDFWIFGESYRLFSNTEGAIKDTLYDYAKEILKIDNPEIITDSRKEVDLFLVKTELESETRRMNIVVEIKRPSKVLGKEEFDQIENYSRIIRKEPSCNGDNTYWEFYLIGDNYDDYIADDKIGAMQNHGEKNRGLAGYSPEGKSKIYVRKWSDILCTEWGYKMKYLKEKLMIKPNIIDASSPQDIVDNMVKNT